MFDEGELMTQSDASIVVPPDLQGEHYGDVLRRLHETLLPKTYLEIGVDKGDTLALSRCHTIGIDPSFQIGAIQSFKQPILNLYQMTSDNFFSKYSPSTIFGQPVDMAFLDGMHRCEFLLRDFINTERFCKRNSLVLLHDCLPVEPAMTERDPGAGAGRMLAPHREGWWTGDVWRTALLIKRKRPDIRLTALDAVGTGLLILTNLNPANRILDENYDEFVEEMMSWTLDGIGIDPYFKEVGAISTETVKRHEDITRKFWL